MSTSSSGFPVVPSLLLLWAVLIVIVPAAACLRSLWWCCRWGRLHFASWWRTFVMSHAGAALSPEDGASQQKIAEIASERFQVRAKSMIKLAVYLLLPITAVAVVRMGMKASGYDWKLWTMGSLAPLHGGTLLVFRYPRHATPTKFRWALLVIQIREVVLAIFPGVIEEVIERYGLVFLSPVTGLIFSGGVRMWLAWVLQEGRFAWMLYLTSWPWLVLARVVAGSEFESMRHTVAAYLIMGVFVCLLAAAAETGTRASIKMELEVSATRESSRAVHNLLSSLCDAVVHLSDDCLILKGQSTLSALLLLDASTPQLNFGSVILHDQDKLDFMSFIQRPCENFAQTIHLTLRDRNSSPVPVQLFLAHCKDLDGSVIHVVGVRDGGTDRPLPAMDADSSATDRLVRDERRPSASAPPLPSISEGESSEGGDSFTLLEMEVADIEAKVWMDANMTMLKWTPAFVEILGFSSAGTNFMSFVSDKPKFTKVIQESSNKLLYMDDIVGASASLPLEVVIDSPLHGMIQLRGSISLDVVEDETGDSLADCMRLCLNIRKWRPVSRVRRGKKKKSRRRSVELELSSPRAGPAPCKLAL
mmetsp:Transcript_72023/g.171946  ORF Transcript_72023/g.171946 Transcript_72023/m.171946 type:complete len:589 (+) Transcript_72023:262-2028(+)